MSPSMAKLAVVPPVVGSARTEMKGTLASPIRAIAALVFIICIRDIMPSCIRMPPEQETMMSGRRSSMALSQARAIFSPTTEATLPPMKPNSMARM